MKQLIFLGLLLISSFSIGQITMSSNTKGDITEIIKLTTEGKVSQQLRDRFAINTIYGIDYVSFVAKISSTYSKTELINSDVLVGAKIGEIVSIKYPLTDLANIEFNSNFVQLEIAGKIKPMLHKAPGDVRADSVWAGYGLPEGYTGKDVLIGITDWGFDYSSPMYYDTLLQDSRILAAWDQFKTSGPAPANYSYGTEYSTPAELILAQADTSNIYSYATHGSHVAGIAGGSGSGTPYRGIAFESNFLFTTFLVDESSVLDAWEWMYNKSIDEGKRLVINMSWGLYHMNAIDGTSLLSQALDNYSALGVVFVSSAGNNGNVNFHIQKDFTTDTLYSQVQFYNSAALSTLWGQSIHMWGEQGVPFEAGIEIYNGTTFVGESSLFSTATTTNYIDSFVVVNTDTIWFNLSADATHPSNNRPQIRLRVKIPPIGYNVVLKSTATNGTVHYWNVTELTSDVGNWGMPFTAFSVPGISMTAGNKTHGIGAPSCSYSSISVAAHSSEFRIFNGSLYGGQEASFSSLGPLINDTLKPDISGPGVAVTSSISSYTDNSFTQVASVLFNGRTYPFAAFSGTSMSSPVVAGVVALILDANPYLSPQQIKDIIKQTARLDQHTGPIPPHSTMWGWGKVNAHAAIVLALNTTGVQQLKEEPKWEIYPNPSSGGVTISNLTGEIQSIQVFDYAGKVQNVRITGKVLHLAGLSAGIYIVRIIRDNKVEQRKLVKQ